MVFATGHALLNEGRTSGALFDTDRFRRRLESAYVQMWQRHERGEAVESFEIAQRLVHAADHAPHFSR